MRLVTSEIRKVLDDIYRLKTELTALSKAVEELLAEIRKELN